jgi:DNA-directed RNA polymerase subunit RPC12/RpoP
MGEYQCCECGAFAEFVAMGPYRAQCTNCDSIIMNEELVVKREVKEN